MRLNPFDTDNIDVRGGGGSRFPGGGAGRRLWVREGERVIREESL